MLFTSLSSVAASQHVLYALLGFGRNEVAARVILGLALLAVVEILAGLLLMRGGIGHHRVRR